MISIFTICLALLAEPSFARTKSRVKPNREPQALIWAAGAIPEVKAIFSQPGFQVMDAAQESSDFAESGYIPPRQRNAIFRKLKLDNQISGMDELAKDMLVLSARFESTKVTKKYFPSFSEVQLRRLKKEVGG